MTFMRVILKGVIIILTLSISALTCTQSDRVAYNVKSKHFFDLKGYFNAESQRLQKNGRKVTKTVVADGKTESQTVDEFDFHRELDFFVGADINRPAWSDKYAVDTSLNRQYQITQLIYKCIDKSLKVQNIVVDFEVDVVKNIRIESNTSNSIATSSQTLVYQPAIGYSIESRQKAALGDEQLFKVKVFFN
jgi:hypothetical protein